MLFKKIFWKFLYIFHFCSGEMAERSNAAVLKTVDCNRSGGSNPSLSAAPKGAFFLHANWILLSAAFFLPEMKMQL